MAATKKASARRSGSPKSNGSGGSKRKPKAKKAKASSAPKAASQAASNGAGSEGTVKEAVTTGAHGAADVVRKAKVPLVASGAAVAGVAGALVMSRTGRRRKVLGVKLPKRSKVHLPTVHMPKANGFKADAVKISGAVADAAKQADQFGQRVSRVASSVQTVGETAKDAAKKS